MSLPSAEAGPSRPTVHPSRLAKFNDNSFQPQFGSSSSTASSSRPTTNVQPPVDSGANSIPLRPTVKKRRVPVWTLPLKPLSKTAKAKKKAEEKKRAQFYAGAFRTEAQREKDRPKKKLSGKAHNKEQKRLKVERLRKQRREKEQNTVDAQESQAEQASGINEDQTVEQPVDQDQTTTQGSVKSKEKGKDKDKDISGEKKKKKRKHRHEIFLEKYERKEEKKRLKLKLKAITTSEPDPNLNEEIAMDENPQPLTSGSNVQNAITLQSSPEQEEPRTAITIDEEEERIEYGPRPPKGFNDITKHTQSTSTSTSNITPSNDTGAQRAEAGPSVHRVYNVRYPVGGETYDNDGDGIFVNVETEDSLNIWIDTALRDRISLIRKIEAEGGQISADHTDEDTQLLILHPGSTYLFDTYCYPEWLKPRDLQRYRLMQEETGKRNEAWQKKVILKAWWIDECVKAGRYLGHKDNWGSCRAGGPPSDIAISTERQDGETINVYGDTEDEEDEEIQEENDEDQPAIHDSDRMEIDEEDQALPVVDDLQIEENNPIITVNNSPATNPIDIDAAEPNDMSHQSPASYIEILPALSTDISQPNEPLSRHSSIQPPETAIHAPSNSHVDSDATEIAPWAMTQQIDEAGPSNYTQDAGDNAAMEEDEVEQEEEDEGEEEPVDPKRMFFGLKFWVDTTYYDRISLIRRIRAAGGALVTSYAESTHVLIHEYKHSQWHSIVESLTKEGIWFMKISWVVKSLDQGRKLREDEHVVLHGNPTDLNTDQKPIIRTSSGHPANEPVMSAEELDSIFQREKMHVDAGGTVKSLAAFLVSKYGCYSEEWWCKLYYTWIRKEGRFAYLAPKVKKPSVEPQASAPTVSQSTSSQIKVKRASNQPSLPTEKIAEILTAETLKRGTMNNTEFANHLGKRYPAYTAKHWATLISNWTLRHGRFANYQQDQSSSSTTTGSSVELPQNSITRTEYSNEELDRFFSDPTLSQGGSRSDSKIGKDLAAKYGAFHSTTWSIMYNNWCRKIGQFKPGANTTSRDSIPVNRRSSATSTSTKPSSASPTKSSVPSLTEEPEEGSKESLDAEQMARIFKSREEQFTKQKLTSIEIGLVLKTEVGIYARATWRLQWTHWWRKEGKFADINPSLQSTIATKAYAEQNLPFKGVKPSSSTSSTPARSHSSTPSQNTSPSKRSKPTPKPAKYTMAEEKQMAEFLSQHSYSNPNSYKVWLDYAALHPERSASAYAQHYSTFGFRIDSFRSKKKARDTDSEINIDDLMAEPSVPSGSQSRPVEIDDDDDDDEDDPPIIVIDDD